MVKTTVKERRNYTRAKRVLSIQFRLFEKKGRGVEDEWHLSTRAV